MTYAQAQEIAEDWINAGQPRSRQREVRVREFDAGFVCWAVDPDTTPEAERSKLRLVIARESGASTLWPALAVNEVVRQYEEFYVTPTEPNPAGAAKPVPSAVEATSFNLLPPNWFEEAAAEAKAAEAAKLSADPKTAAAPPAPAPSVAPDPVPDPPVFTTPPASGRPAGDAPTLLAPPPKSDEATIAAPRPAPVPNAGAATVRIPEGAPPLPTSGLPTAPGLPPAQLLLFGPTPMSAQGGVSAPPGPAPASLAGGAASAAGAASAGGAAGPSLASAPTIGAADGVLGRPGPQAAGSSRDTAPPPPPPSDVFSAAQTVGGRGVPSAPPSPPPAPAPPLVVGSGSDAFASTPPPTLTMPGGSDRTSPSVPPVPPPAWRPGAEAPPVASPVPPVGPPAGDAASANGSPVPPPPPPPPAPGPNAAGGAAAGTAYQSTQPPGAPPFAGPGMPPPAPNYGYPTAGPQTPPPGPYPPGVVPPFAGMQPGAPVPPGVPAIGPGTQAVVSYRAPDGSEQTLILRSESGTPHPEWKALQELRRLNVPPDQVTELHTDLELCDLPGGYCARMVKASWPNVRISHTVPYGRDQQARQSGMAMLLDHLHQLHQLAAAPQRNRPVKMLLPPPGSVPRLPPAPPQQLAAELGQAFGPSVFRFEQRAVSRQGVAQPVAETLTWAGLPRDFAPFFWAQAQDGRPIPTLAELAAERGLPAAPDFGGYLVLGNDYGRQLCVQYGTNAVVAVDLEMGGEAPRFVNSGVPEFVRSLALLGRMWRLRYGLTPDQAGRWTSDFQTQLLAIDPAALLTPESWWAVLLEQFWDGLL